jgi:NADPH:quinone reductase
MNEMRAVALDRFGGPETLSVRTMAVPEIKPGQILLRVESAGVGIWDVAERQGILAPMFDRLYGIKASFPYVIGSEGAGTVVAVASNVTRFRNGDRVYADVFASDPKRGFYAEYTAVDAERAMPIPSNLTVEQAGALFIDGSVAIQGLDTLGLKPGEKLMIFGASGGIGHLAVQLAQRMGAQVFAVASREDGVALVRRLGANIAVEGHDHSTVLASAREFAPNGFDAALITVRGQDPEAMHATENALTTMREGGRVAYPWTNNLRPAPKAPPNVQLLSFGVVDERGKISTELMGRLNRLIGAGPFEVHVGKTFSLDHAAEAHQTLGSHYLGRLALLPRT